MPMHTRAILALSALSLLAACGDKSGTNEMASLDERLTNTTDATGSLDAEVLRAAGGTIEKAPPATVTTDAGPQQLTLGGLAKRQAGGKGGGGCNADVRYGPEWAKRLPKAFALYPRATLQEAAGVSNGRCDIVIASFTTPASVDQVIDFYYTQARRAGYDAEHLLYGQEHRLGGLRGEDGPAYVVFVRKNANGGAEADIVANIS